MDMNNYIKTFIMLIFFSVAMLYVGYAFPDIFSKIKGGFEDLGDKIKDTGKKGIQGIKTAAQKTKDAFETGVEFGGKIFHKTGDLLNEAARRFVSCAKVVGPGAEYAGKKVAIETAKLGLEIAKKSVDAAKLSVEVAKQQVKVAEEAQRAALKASEEVGKVALDTGKFAVTVGGKVIELSGEFIDILLDKGIVPERVSFKTQLSKVHRSKFEFEGRVAGNSVLVAIDLQDIAGTLFSLLSAAFKVKKALRAARDL